MSDPKYKAGIRAGILLSFGPRDWPATIEGLGPMMGGQPFSKCEDCSPHDKHKGWTWRRYGGRPLCHEHAFRRTE